MALYLKSLPVAISSQGKPIAIVSLPPENFGLSEMEVYTKELAKKLGVRPGSTEFCEKHPGSMKLTCGCK